MNNETTTATTAPTVTSKDKNQITYVNQQAIIKNAVGQKSFRELLGYYKGSISAVLTFIMTNRLAVFLGGCSEDELMVWFGQQMILHPELKGVITVTKDVVKVAWNALVANPNLCALVISGFVALGVTVAYGIKKIKTNRKLKKGRFVFDDKGAIKKI